jgi:hypothetical protein
MLIEAHFTAILPLGLHVVFWQHVLVRLFCSTLRTTVFTRRAHLEFAFAIVTVAILWRTSALVAAPAFSCTFDGPETTWQVLDNGVRAALMKQELAAGGARDSNGLERVVVAATAGESVLLGCATPPVAVLDELQVRVWVKAARPDVSIAVRVRLPRSVDSETKAARSLILKAGAYHRPGQWQQLALSDVPKLLAAQVRLLRATPGNSIDPHEAYIDEVVLVVPGDPKGFEVETDQLDVDGVVVAPAYLPKPPLAIEPHTIIKTRFETDPPASGDSTSPVRLQGTMLTVEGRPFLPRVIDWNGEPLKLLAERGFNVVRLRKPPEPEQIADAQRHDLWFLCKPPQPEELANLNLGAVGDRILGWYLEDDALDADPNYAQRWAERVRERDKVYGRPILIAPTSNWGGASKAADIVIARNARTAVMEDDEFAAWLKSRSGSVRPGTPLWVELNTQFGEAARSQINLLAHTSVAAPGVEAAQLQSLLRVAELTGVRGFAFRSSSSLSESDAETRVRATMLEILNRKLQLLEPWLAGGKLVSSEMSTDGTTSASVLYVDRARLLIPEKASNSKERALAKSAAAKDVTFLVPGVSESSQIHFLTPVSMRALTAERIAGGTRISVPRNEDGLILITEDLKVIQSLRQHVARHGGQTLKLERELIVNRAKSIFQTEQRLAQLGVKSGIGTDGAAAVSSRLGQLDSLISSGRLEEAQTQAAAVTADFNRLIEIQSQSVGGEAGLQSNALALTCDRLLDRVALARSFANLRGSENLLAGGDFEDLAEMTQAGWQHVVHEAAGATTHAVLSAVQPEHGSYSLELQAGTTGKSPPVSEPLVWIVSPAIPVDADKLVEITGWVRVDRPFESGAGGLAIVDTLGGPELSLLVRQTSGWQIFRIVRAVPKAQELRLTFALTGAGAANVDAVMVRNLQQPVARRLPEVTRAGDDVPRSASESASPIIRLPQTR